MASILAVRSMEREVSWQEVAVAAYREHQRNLNVVSGFLEARAIQTIDEALSDLIDVIQAADKGDTESLYRLREEIKPLLATFTNIQTMVLSRIEDLQK